MSNHQKLQLYYELSAAENCAMTVGMTHSEILSPEFCQAQRAYLEAIRKEKELYANIHPSLLEDRP